MVRQQRYELLKDLVQKEKRINLGRDIVSLGIMNFRKVLIC